MYKKYTPANPPPLCILSEIYILYIPYRSLFLVEGFGKISSLVFEDFIVGSKCLSDFRSRKTIGQSPPTLYPSLAPRVWHEWPGDPEVPRCAVQIAGAMLDSRSRLKEVKSA